MTLMLNSFFRMFTNIIYNVAMVLFIVGLTCLVVGTNILTYVISLELILLSMAVYSLMWSYLFDDLLGANLALLILPIAGAESAVSLAYLIAFAPVRGSILLK
jgi:NADH:ubiquinone oxidoreductase subunit K